jgi:hypothetical protein
LHLQGGDVEGHSLSGGPAAETAMRNRSEATSGWISAADSSYLLVNLPPRKKYALLEAAIIQ